MSKAGSRIPQGAREALAFVEGDVDISQYWVRRQLKLAATRPV